MNEAVGWVVLLQQAVARHGQSGVARRLGLSPSTVSRVLRGIYGAETTAIAHQVLDVYSAEPVACPVLGAIRRQRCAEERQKPFSTSSPLRVALHQACKRCAHNPQREEEV